VNGRGRGFTAEGAEGAERKSREERKREEIKKYQ
jgi:hypothetical protein